MPTTPDGTFYKTNDPTTIGECWITDTETYAIQQIKNDSDKSDFLDDYIIDACAEVNRICNRKFNKQVIDKIFKDQNLQTNDYINLRLWNTPIASVDKIWLQVTDTFTEINKSYTQILFNEGVIKIMPKDIFMVYGTLPPNFSRLNSNLWIRYTGGYEIEDVPRPVKRATALMVKYLFDLEELDGGIKSYRTQTYQQTNSDAETDPVMSQIMRLLQKYIIYSSAS